MSQKTDTTARRSRGSGGGSMEANAKELAETHELEALEGMAVAETDETRRAELEMAIRIGREARGGSTDSGGAMHESSEPDGAAYGRKTGGRIVLDGSIPPPPLGAPLERPIVEPPPRPSRWERLKELLS